MRGNRTHALMSSLSADQLMIATALHSLDPDIRAAAALALAEAPEHVRAELALQAPPSQPKRHRTKKSTPNWLGEMGVRL